MSIEALWAVNFRGKWGLGSGVAVFETDRIFGGDSGWYYLGSYELTNRNLRAEVCVYHYGEDVLSVTGHHPGEKFKINIVGQLASSDEITACGTVVDRDPNDKLEFSMRRLADLP